jgi:hypothetical protein
LLSHTLRITAVTAGVMLCTLLPFLPGDYDSLAMPLSMMSQVFGIVGLLLVPVGVLWLASGYWSPLEGKQFGFAVASLIASTVVWLLISVTAAATGGLLLGLGGVVFWIYVISRVWGALKRLKTAPPRHASAAAFYLVIIPTAVAVLQMVTIAPAIESSRSRAIRNSAPLIADIEQYRTANGRYPVSLMSLNPDYKPGVIGVKEYHYEPSGDAYNLFFEQVAFSFGTREIVMYNPRDQQAMTSHTFDRLQLTPQALALEQTRGHYAVHDAPHPHWKYFWFD